MASLDLLCLANSRKYGNRCVAGLRMDGGGWVRPVSRLEDGSLPAPQIRLSDGSAPRMLDVLRVPVGQPMPKPHHPEDVAIEPGTWSLVSRPCDWDVMVRLLRKVLVREPVLLGSNWDRIPYPSAGQGFGASLAAVSATDLKWSIVTSQQGTRQTRAVFTLATQGYDLAVTDDGWERRLSYLQHGLHPLAAGGIGDGERVILIVSLGEPFEGYCYKLVAGVLVVNPTTRTAWG